MSYIYQKKSWPEFTWHQETISGLLAAVRNRQGRLLGKMEALGFNPRAEAALHTQTLDIVKSSEIEGVFLDPAQVRSSIARRLGIDIANEVHASRDVEGIVEMMLDATQNYTLPLTAERLFGWHAALFPSGRSGQYKITVGAWRDNEKGPMQIVSGPMGREQVHFEAPGAEVLDKEMNGFLQWFNSHTTIDPVLKSAIAHFWFVSIHPFDDGNGRIARAIADMQMARADGTSQRFYSMSAQIREERKEYYKVLEESQKGSMDITEWLEWFLNCLDHSLTATTETLAVVLAKARFWDQNANTPLNDRQRLMLNKLLDGFDGKLTSSKWAKIAKCSQDTALRDLQGLLDNGVLAKEEAGGRSTSYVLTVAIK
jgi:Fic family protein